MLSSLKFDPNLILRYRVELFLFAILLLGLFLRVDDLSKESLWFDEANGIKFANSENFVEVIKTLIRVDPNHTPLYYIIMHYWIKLFGSSEFSVRFPSVIFGFLGILMIYKVGSLIFDRETGLLASLILAVSQFHIYYSQEARMYSLLPLLTLFSFYFFIKLLERMSTGISIGYLLSSILLMYTHVFGLFIIIAQNVYIATSYVHSKEFFKKSIKKWILLQIILLLLFIPQGIVYMKITGRIQSDDFHSADWIGNPSLDSMLGSFKEFSGPPILFLPFFLLLAFSIIPCAKSNGNNKLSHNNRTYLLFLWLLAPIVLPYLISKILAPMLVTRYTIGASLALYLFVAKGIRDINQKHLKIIVLSLIIGLSLSHVLDSRNGIHKQQYREATADLESRAENSDLLLITPGWSQPAFDYYSKRTDLVKMAMDSGDMKELWPTVEDHRRVWVISFDGFGSMDQRLPEFYLESYHKSYFGVQVSLFEKNETQN